MLVRVLNVKRLLPILRTSLQLLFQNFPRTNDPAGFADLAKSLQLKVSKGFKFYLRICEMGVNNFDFIVIRYLCTVRPFRKELETEKKINICPFTKKL